VIESTTRGADRQHRRARRTLTSVVIAVCLWETGALAQTVPPFTIDPAMARGSATAPVTIVEFSDYQ